MNGLFWLLLIPAVLAFGLIAWATDRTLCALQRTWRRRQVRKEMTHSTLEQESAAIQLVIDVSRAEERDRRYQLESLATAQDKRERRILH